MRRWQTAKIGGLQRNMLCMLLRLHAQAPDREWILWPDLRALLVERDGTALSELSRVRKALQRRRFLTAEGDKRVRRVRLTPTGTEFALKAIRDNR